MAKLKTKNLIYHPSQRDRDGKYFQSKYQDCCNLTPYQNFLYKRALFGLNIYTEDELSVMHELKKKRIKRVHQKTQYILNTWKQEMCNQFTNDLLKTYFPNSELALEIVTESVEETSEHFVNKTSMKQLGVSKTDIINKLIEYKILPGNFYTLTEPL